MELAPLHGLYSKQPSWVFLLSCKDEGPWKCLLRRRWLATQQFFSWTRPSPLRAVSWEALLGVQDGASFSIFPSRKAAARSSLGQQRTSSTKRRRWPALVWVQALGDRLRGLDVLLFVDSKAAEGILLKGYSKSPQLAVIASLFWKTVRQGRASAWIDRAPTHLNVADAISRGCFSSALALQAEKLQAQTPVVSAWETLLGFLEGRTPARRLLEPQRLNRSDKRRRLNQGLA